MDKKCDQGNMDKRGYMDKKIQAVVGYIRVNQTLEIEMCLMGKSIPKQTEVDECNCEDLVKAAPPTLDRCTASQTCKACWSREPADCKVA